VRVVFTSQFLSLKNTRQELAYNYGFLLVNILTPLGSRGTQGDDAELMRNIINTLGCGRVQKHSKKSAVEFVVTSLWGIVEKIIPFFEKYPLCKEGLKMLDYKDLCEIVELIKEEAHLTEEGINKIRKIKSEMRIRRIRSAGENVNKPISVIETPGYIRSIFVYDSTTLRFSTQ
jgi:hypothetical protein